MPKAFGQFQYPTSPLAPFTGLHVDYLMALLDDEEQKAVEAMLRTAVAATGVVLSAVEGAR
ncbi:hypothetical protein ABZV31_37375 [Streptomyces sp. NPDC005202]|uniref:hypothetical protein n=1 Tax=Streptomyces sp. NPDC005202 TaxID=3157021 RepID=UPI0033A40E99